MPEAPLPWRPPKKPSPARPDQLRTSPASRAAIDQGLGIIMVRQRCTQDTAFAALRAASQNRNVKLHDVAVDLVASVTGQAPQPPPFGRA